MRRVALIVSGLLLMGFLPRASDPLLPPPSFAVAPASQQYDIRFVSTQTVTVPISFGLPMEDNFLDQPNIAVDGAVSQKSSCTQDIQAETRFCRVAALVDFSGGTVDSAVTPTATAEPAGAAWTLDGDLPNEPNMEVWAEITDLNGVSSGAQAGTWTASLTDALAGGGTWNKTLAHDPGEVIADGFIERAKANFSVPFDDGAGATHDNLRAYFDVYCYSADSFSTVWGCAVDVKIRNGFWDCTDATGDTDCQDYHYSLAVKRLNAGTGATETVASYQGRTNAAAVTVTDTGQAVNGSEKWDGTRAPMQILQLAATGEWARDDLGKIFVAGGGYSKIIAYIDANTVQAMETPLFDFPGLPTPPPVAIGTATIAAIGHEYASQVVERVWWKNDPGLTIAHGVSSLLASKMVMNYAVPDGVAQFYETGGTEGGIVGQVDKDGNNPFSIHRFNDSTGAIMRAAIVPTVPDNDSDVDVIPTHQQNVINRVVGGHHPTDSNFQKAMYATTDLWVQGAPFMLLAGSTGQVIDIFSTSEVSGNGWVDYYRLEPTITYGDRLADVPINNASHANAFGYLPYLLTGRWAYVDALNGQLGFYFHESVQYGNTIAESITNGSNRAVFTQQGQTREAYAWLPRMLAQAMAITPTGSTTLQSVADMKSYFDESWNLGVTEYIDDGLGIGGNCTIAQCPNVCRQVGVDGPCRAEDQWLFTRSSGGGMKAFPYQFLGYAGKSMVHFQEIGQMTADLKRFADNIAISAYQVRLSPAITNKFTTWGATDQWAAYGTPAAVKAAGIGWDIYEAESSPPQFHDRCNEAQGTFVLYYAGFGPSAANAKAAFDWLVPNGDKDVVHAPGEGSILWTTTPPDNDTIDYADMANWTGSALECYLRMNVAPR